MTQCQRLRFRTLGAVIQPASASWYATNKSAGFHLGGVGAKGFEVVLRPWPRACNDAVPDTAASRRRGDTSTNGLGPAHGTAALRTR